jgi:hypothetical protein
MFSTIRRHLRLSPAGVVAVIALVFAMAGGAFAANHSGSGATASAKAKKGPRGPKGATGAAGAQGPAGPAGKDGTNGTNGTTGATGATGQTGATGFSGFTKTLPPKETETGTWGFTSTAAETQAYIPISFNIPLETGVAAELLPKHYTGTPGANCPGSVTEPTAKPGFLCVYTLERNGVPIEGVEPGGREVIFNGETEAHGQAGRTGAILWTFVQDLGEFYGVWAVSAPE